MERIQRTWNDERTTSRFESSFRPVPGGMSAKHEHWSYRGSSPVGRRDPRVRDSPLDPSNLRRENAIRPVTGARPVTCAYSAFRGSGAQLTGLAIAAHSPDARVDV